MIIKVMSDFIYNNDTISIYNINSLNIKSSEVTKGISRFSQDDPFKDRLLAQYDTELGHLGSSDTSYNNNSNLNPIKEFPYKSKFNIEELDVPKGYYYSVNGKEVLKIYIPSGYNRCELLSSNQMTIIIKLDDFELDQSRVIVFDSNSNGTNLDESAVDIHCPDGFNSVRNHLDTFLTHVFDINTLQVHESVARKCDLDADIIGNTYVDRNGFIYFLGNY